MSSHILRIHTDIYGVNSVSRNECYCTSCNTRDLEDKYHFNSYVLVIMTLDKNILNVITMLNQVYLNF